MKTTRLSLLAACALGLTAMGLDTATAAPGSDDGQTATTRRAKPVCHNGRCENKNGRYLQVIVRKKRIRNDDYDYNRNYSFEVGGFERPTLRYGNTGFIGQAGYFGNGGFRPQLGASSFDNLR